MILKRVTKHAYITVWLGTAMDIVMQLVTKACLVLRRDGFGVLLGRFGEYFERRVHGLSKIKQKITFRYKLQEKWPVEKPLVSVVIPCYNYGKFINGAIESVLAQTFQRFEILVIDDGSTEELTRSVLHNLRYEKTKIIHQANQGLAETRNNGAEMAAGKYICYLDADDLIEPTYLEKALYILERDESLGSCYSWVQCFGDTDSVWRTEDMDPFFLRRYTAASSHSVIRKEAWIRVKVMNGSGFLTKYNGYFEDWVFWIDMVQCGFRGQVIREPLIRYRVHKTSLGATHKPGWDKMLAVLHEDRKEFFYNRSYRAKLEESLNKRIYIENCRINLSSPSFYKTKESDLS
jgi:glycosyltransferase involved in cell wall biosynthesis